jgi:flagellar hook-associated protein 2
MSTLSSGVTSTTFTPLQFTGISQYSSDFQSILTRADAIAALPVTALQNQQTTIQQEQTDLTSLGTAAAAVGSALTALGKLGAGLALSATSTDNNVVTATNTGATAGTSYSITNVTSIASPAAETSRVYSDGTTIPVSSTGTMQLVLGNKTYAITLTNTQNNLTGLQGAINNLGAGVTASILTTASGDYLSLAASSPGATTLQLIDNPQNALKTGSSGSTTTPASATSTATYPNTGATIVSASGNMELVFGGKSYSISLAAGQNNLTGLQTAINGLSNAGVTASITTQAGQSQLSITANKPGTNALQLLENPTNLVTSTNQGKNTVFTLNGIATPISEPNTTINDIIPGVTLKFVGTTATAIAPASAEAVTIKVATDTSQIQSALQTLVSSYNTLSTAENAQFGTGSLTGNSIIYQIRQAMSAVFQNQGSGSINNLVNLGVGIDKTTLQMTLDQPTFSALSDSQIAASLQLLGTSTTGIGGLAQAFNSITDPLTGTIQEQESQWTTTNTNLTDQINTKNTQNQAREQTLNRLLQAADATSAELASQQSILTASINSLDFTSYGKVSS